MRRSIRIRIRIRIRIKVRTNPNPNSKLNPNPLFHGYPLATTTMASPANAGGLRLEEKGGVKSLNLNAELLQTSADSSSFSATHITHVSGQFTFINGSNWCFWWDYGCIDEFCCVIRKVHIYTYAYKLMLVVTKCKQGALSPNYARAPALIRSCLYRCV